MLNVTVIIGNKTAKCCKLRSNFAKNHSHVTALFKKLQLFLSKIAVIKKNTIIFVNFAIPFQILQSYFEGCSHVIADFEKLQSHLESCSHVIADFEI